MRTGLLLFYFLIQSVIVSAQSFSLGTPDSVKSLPYPNSTGNYTISNPLIHNGTSFTNPPIAGFCFNNCKSDKIYFYDLGFQIPTSVTITGIEVIHTHGGCNSGSFMIDTLQLAYNGNPIGTIKRDSSSATAYDTLGSSSDLWGSVLTPTMINSNQFGVMINSTGTGICTYGQFNVQIRVYYSCTPGQALGFIPDSVVSITKSGSTGSYTISNPLTHTGTQFNNPPTTVNCINNCRSNYLHFYKTGINIPANALITGVEVYHRRGACNGGSFMVDTLELFVAGNVLGQLKRDTSSVFETDTLGGPMDTWNAVLTPAIVNDPSFGIRLFSTGTGICTYGQFNLEFNIYYCTPLPNTLNSWAEIDPILVYPNPAQGYITVELPEGVQNLKYVLLDIQGRILITGNLTPEESKINTESLTPGLYFLQTEYPGKQSIKIQITAP
jgi:hypothetical protein